MHSTPGSAGASPPASLAGFQASPIATWVSLIDPMQIEWANAAALELWSAADLDELRGRDFSGGSEASARQAREWLAAFRSGTLDVVETDWTVYPRGVPRRVRLYISGIELDDGRWALLQQAIVKHTPIDPEILRGAEAIRHSSTAVASLTPSGEVLSRNPSMIRAFGPSTPASQWFEQPEAYAEILAVGRHGRVYRAELGSRLSGALRHYAVEAYKVVDPVTGADAILVHLLDETARRGAELDAERKQQLVEQLERALATVEQQEQQLRHSQKMLAVGTLAGGIAHDFNNLLTVIIGSCELATLTLARGGDVRPQLEEIAAAVERASSLTRQLLAFGRKQTLQPRRVELSALVRELAKLLARVIGEHISLTLELDERPCWLVADPGQLEQVIMNLVVNACDAMPEGGSLRVRTRLEPETIVLEVADTGVGMPPELLSRIFDPFFTTKEVGKGTGLGLSTVHGIVEQSGGRIEVESEPGRGTRFIVTLPRDAG